MAVYCATKAAVISLTQSAGLALIKHRINVNAIAPGVIDTPMWDLVDSQFARYENLAPGAKKRQIGAAVPYGRMGLPEDIAGAAVFLIGGGIWFIPSPEVGRVRLPRSRRRRALCDDRPRHQLHHRQRPGPVRKQSA